MTGVAGGGGRLEPVVLDDGPGQSDLHTARQALADALTMARTGVVTSAVDLAATQRVIIEAATLAPSIHNRQPWRFAADDGGLDLFAEAARRLPVLDPDGRLVHLSCGAALLNAQVAARALGWRTRSILLPTPSDRSHLARLELTAGARSRPSDHTPARGILLRHTRHDAFQERALPPELLERLRLAAEECGAALVVVSGDDLLELEVLLAWADAGEGADPADRAETAASVRTGHSCDGIPASALADDPERGSSLRLRDFAFVGPSRTGAEPPRAEKPDVVLIIADGDGPLPWLRAGQALEAVLLHAAEQGVLGQPLTQATGRPAGRLRLRTALGLVGMPQMALRLGYERTAVPTPRLPVGDVPAQRPESRQA